ncbi:hypothetical protein HHK36_028883 [Tetracentron sinense]|uniref:C2 domain-containing protein n=1 Tax=Tetracentron sinense TaxID=13715 RepID=A0A835D0M8_TETSI|nr:hypothetical protein HHK36_028883 [Tetracentron sinense]
MSRMASSSSLEITVISAEGLRLGRHSIRKNAFAIVQTDSRNSRSTKMDTEGGSYPSWNEKLALELPNNAHIVTVQVQCKTSSGDRTVGTAKIPVSDFIGDYTPAHYLHFLSYRLREHDGERNGIVNLSVRVKEAHYVDCLSRPWLGAQRPCLGVGDGENNSVGIVTGVPA